MYIQKFSFDFHANGNQHHNQGNIRYFNKKPLQPEILARQNNIVIVIVIPRRSL